MSTNSNVISRIAVMAIIRLTTFIGTNVYDCQHRLNLCTIQGNDVEKTISNELICVVRKSEITIHVKRTRFRKMCEKNMTG